MNTVDDYWPLVTFINVRMTAAFETADVFFPAEFLELQARRLSCQCIVWVVLFNLFVYYAPYIDVVYVSCGCLFVIVLTIRLIAIKESSSQVID